MRRNIVGEALMTSAKLESMLRVQMVQFSDHGKHA